MFSRSAAPVLAALALFAVVACGPAPQRAAASFASLSTPQLCSQAGLAQPADLLAIEAELGARGAMQCTTTYGSTRYVGERTGTAVGLSRYGREASAQSTPGTGQAPGGGDRNCGDFGSAAEAQRFFLAAGGPTRDPHDLDRDGDGFACEWGAQVQRSYRSYQSSLRAASRRTYGGGSRCYRGPRGGTYTITASGRRNYGGC